MTCYVNYIIFTTIFIFTLKIYFNYSSMDGRTRILIVEDQTLVRKGFKSLINMYRPGWEVYEAVDGIKALITAREHEPHLILMDYFMPKLDGIKAAKFILEEFPETKIIMVSTEQSPEFIAGTFSAGFVGIVSKDSSDQEFMEAIDTVCSGEMYIREDLRQYANIDLKNYEKKKIYKKHPRATELSVREVEILRHLSNGLKYREVGQQLGISKRTVHNHKANICKKYQLHSIADLVRFAVQHNLTT